MNNQRDRMRNLLAELIARFLIGFGAAALFCIGYGYNFIGLRLWEFFAICGIVGIVAALFGTRKGPGLE